MVTMDIIHIYTAIQAGLCPLEDMIRAANVLDLILNLLSLQQPYEAARLSPKRTKKHRAIDQHCDGPHPHPTGIRWDSASTPQDQPPACQASRIQIKEGNVKRKTDMFPSDHSIRITVKLVQERELLPSLLLICGVSVCSATQRVTIYCQTEPSVYIVSGLFQGSASVPSKPSPNTDLWGNALHSSRA
ncbi:unnamed protein product [Natator depressus]